MEDANPRTSRVYGWLAALVVAVAGGGLWFAIDSVNRPYREIEAEKLESQRQAKIWEAGIIAEYGSVDAFLAKSDISVEITNWGRDGNYLEINGTVTNKSKFTCSYWRVAYEFLDNKGKVVHAGWTNSSTTLRPGASEKWDSSERAFEPEPDSLRAWVEDSRLN